MALRLVPAALVVLGCDAVRPTAADAAAADAQASSCEGGGALPEALVGSFWLVPAGCAAASPDGGDAEWHRIGLLYVDRCGAAMTGIPDGYETHGVIRPAGTGHVYESETGLSADGGRFAFTIEVLDEERAGAPVLALRSETSAEPWEAWAISRRNVESLPPAPAPPRVSACAERESWTTHAFSGSGPGALLASDEVPIAPGEASPRLELGERYAHDLRIADPRLQLSTGAGYEGAIARWDDTGGEARFVGSNAACVELDGRVALEWDGAMLVTEMDWLVVDLQDADGDGEKTDLLVRRTRTDWRAAACP